MSKGPSKRLLKVLAQYKDTSDSRYMQGLPGASDLWHRFGLLQWHGDQYGTHFYSITPAGKKALELRGEYVPNGEAA